MNEGTPEEVVCNENLMGCFTTGNKTVPKAQIAEIKVHTAHNMPAALLLWLNILFPLIIMMMLPSPLSPCYFITQAHDTWTLEEDILQDIRDKAREKVSTVFKSL